MNYTRKSFMNGVLVIVGSFLDATPVVGIIILALRASNNQLPSFRGLGLAILAVAAVSSYWNWSKPRAIIAEAASSWTAFGILLAAFLAYHVFVLDGVATKAMLLAPPINCAVGYVLLKFAESDCVPLAA